MTKLKKMIAWILLFLILPSIVGVWAFSIKEGFMNGFYIGLVTEIILTIIIVLLLWIFDIIAE